MDERMKILIAYDGSECANAALEDLSAAGLPPESEALVLSISEYWMPPESVPETSLAVRLDNVEFKRARETAKAALAQAEELAAKAAKRVQQKFPAWQVRHEACDDSPAWGVVKRADEWKPDLIVVGSHGRNLVGRFVLGSVSLKVLTEAQCSVRVARKSESRIEDETPVRLVVGIDGSHGAHQAVAAVANRAWREGGAARLVNVVEPRYNGAGMEEEMKRASDLQQYAAHQLGENGLHVSSVVREGDPKRVLIEEAEKWGADCIFIGAKGHRFMERMLLGSVSYAVAARAHCSVEVVRTETSDGWGGFDVSR